MKQLTVIEKTIIFHVIIAVIHSQMHFILHVEGDIIDWFTAVPTSLILPVVLLLFYTESKFYKPVLRIVATIGMIHGSLRHLILPGEDNISEISNISTGIIFKISVALLLITQGAMLAFSVDFESKYQNNFQYLLTN